MKNSIFHFLPLLIDNFHLTLRPNFFDESRSLDLFQEATIWVPSGVLSPWLVVGLPVIKSAIAEKAFDIVSVANVKKSSRRKEIWGLGHIGGPFAPVGLQSGGFLGGVIGLR